VVLMNVRVAGLLWQALVPVPERLAPVLCDGI
jgi:hypothetical protein